MTIFHIKWEWTIPNLLSILRLLLLPVFVVLYLMSDTRPAVSYTHLDVYKRQPQGRREVLDTVHRLNRERGITAVSYTHLALYRYRTRRRA